MFIPSQKSTDLFDKQDFIEKRTRLTPEELHTALTNAVEISSDELILHN